VKRSSTKSDVKRAVKLAARKKTSVYVGRIDPAVD